MNIKSILPLSIFLCFQVFANESSKISYYGGIDLGAGFQKSDDSVEKNNKNGSYFGAKGFVSYEYDSFKFDVGLGYFNYKIKTDLTSGKYSAVSLETKEPYVHIAPKFKTNDFLIGVDFNYILNKGIMLAPNTNSELMTGLSFGYEKRLDNKISMRIVGTVSRTMDLSNKDLTLGTISLQLGYSGNGNNEMKLNKNQRFIAPNVINTKREITIVSLDDTFIHFDTNSYDLTLKSKALLTELAAFLASNEHIWEGLQIEGHTDFRGGEEYNTILSVKRANSVYEVMTAISMPKDRIIFLGKGKTFPLENGQNDDSLAKNRRVVLKFLNVSEKELLLNFLESLKKKYKNLK